MIDETHSKVKVISAKVINTNVISANVISANEEEGVGVRMSEGNMGMTDSDHGCLISIN